MPSNRPRIVPRPSFLSEAYEINVPTQPVSVVQLIGYPSTQQIQARADNLRQIQQNNGRPNVVELRGSARGFLDEFHAAAYRTQQEIRRVHLAHEARFNNQTGDISEANFRTQLSQAREYWDSLYRTADRTISPNDVYRLWNLLSSFALPNMEQATAQSVIYRQLNNAVLNPVPASFYIEMPLGSNSGVSSPYVMNLHSTRRIAELQHTQRAQMNFFRSVESVLGCSAEALPRVIKKINDLLKTWFPRTKGSTPLAAPTRNETGFYAYPHILVEKVAVTGQQHIQFTDTNLLEGPVDYYYKLYFINFSTIIPALVNGRANAYLMALPNARSTDQVITSPGVNPDPLHVRWVTPRPVPYVANRRANGRIAYRRLRETHHFSGQWIQYIPPRVSQEELRQQEEIRRALRDVGTYIPSATVVARQETYTLGTSVLTSLINGSLQNIQNSVLVTDENRAAMTTTAHTFLQNPVVAFSRNPGETVQTARTFERNINTILHKLISYAFDGYGRSSGNTFDGGRRTFRTEHCSELPGYPFFIRPQGQSENTYPHPLTDSRISSPEGRRTYYQPMAFSCQFKIKRNALESLFLIGEHGPRRNRENMKNEIHQVLRKVNEIAALLGFKISTKMVRVSNPDGTSTRQRLFIFDNLFAPNQAVYVNRHFLHRVVDAAPQNREVPGFFRRLSLNEELSRFLAEFGSAVAPPAIPQEVVVTRNEGARFVNVTAPVQPPPEAPRVVGRYTTF